MAKSEKIYELVGAIVEALESVNKANDLPGFLTGKARDVNGSNASKRLNEAILDEDILLQFAKLNPSQKVSDDEVVRNKDDFVKYISSHLAALERVKSGNYKLILDRFLAGHLLANQVHEILSKLYGEKLRDFPIQPQDRK